MIFDVTDHNKYLYHYTSAQIAIDYILKERTLRLGSYASTNDPKERKSWLFDFGTNEGRDLGVYNRDEQSAWLSGEFKSKTLMACFSRDSESLSGIHINDIFKRGFCKPRMWAQYGDSHRGVCLVFDRERLERQIDLQLADKYVVMHGPVKYIDRSIARDLFREQQYTINVDVLEVVGREEYFYRHLHTHYQQLFFEKMLDWKDENEWRLVAFSQTSDPFYLKYKNSLVGLVFGDETSEADKEKLYAANHDRGVHHIGIRWKNCSPWYDWK